MTSTELTDTRGGGDPRTRAARLAAVQALYEMDMAGAPPDSVLGEFLTERWSRVGLDEPEDVGRREASRASAAKPKRRLLADLVHGTSESRAELDGLIDPALAKGKELEGLDVLLRVILRAGTYELRARPSVPAPVVIDEYVAIGREFFDNGAVALVNGVLDKVARTLRPGELPAERTHGAGKSRPKTR